MISVIAIFYGVEEYIHECVQSIMNQTYKNLQIIFVDDGSKDACPQIIDEYAAMDSRIVAVHKENGGAYSARQEGIKYATGKYIAFVDGDDWIEPEMYESMLSMKKEYDVKIVETGLLDTQGSNITKRTSRIKSGKYVGETFRSEVEPYILYSGSFFHYGILGNVVNKLFDSQLIKKYHSFTDYSNNLVDDLLCALPCIAEAKSIYISYDAFYHYRKRSDSLTRTFRSDVKKTIDFCREDWKTRFNSLSEESNLDKQLQYLEMYLLLMKEISVFDIHSKEHILIPFGGVPHNSRLVIYGAGAFGFQIAAYLQNLNKQNVVAWIDKNAKQMNPVLQIKELAAIRYIDYDYIIIAVTSCESAEGIKKNLLSIGVQEDKIRWIDSEYILNPCKLLSLID